METMWNKVFFALRGFVSIQQKCINKYNVGLVPESEENVLRAESLSLILVAQTLELSCLHFQLPIYSFHLFGQHNNFRNGKKLKKIDI